MRFAVANTLTAALVLTSALAAAQSTSDHQWVNTELLGRGLPNEQYVAIGKGDFAQCTADAKQTAIQAVPVPYCDRASPYGPNMACFDEQEKGTKQREQMFRDLLGGCMARKGWVWAKTR